MSNHISGGHAAPRRNRAVPAALWIVLGLLMAVFLCTFLLFRHFYNSMNIQLEPSPSYSNIDLTPEALSQGEEQAEDGAVVLTEEESQALTRELQNSATENELFSDSDVYNILLLGNDSRADNIHERTDVMLLVSINRKTEEILLTSFLRDIYLYIPGHFSHRLNTANALAGPTLTVETIEQNFAIDIDSYAEVNFSAFVSIIDTLGGVDLSLSAAEAQVVGCGDQDGIYHLSGEEALAYCRIRKLDNDFGRTERQRKLLKALWADLKNTSLTDAYALMSEVLPQVTTDLSQADCLSLLATATQIGSYDLRSAQIPADGAWSYAMIDGMSVLQLDFVKNIDYLREFIYGS